MEGKNFHSYLCRAQRHGMEIYMSNCILKTTGLTKAYDHTQILIDINFCMNQGDFVAVMGPSGAGKSTFMHIISGMDRPTSGKAYIGEHELVAMADKEIANLRLKRIGMVYQQPFLLPTLNLIDNVILPAHMLREKSSKIIYEKAIKLLTLFGMADKINAPANALSGGQLQRGCIARALINDPVILFADKPIGALNSSSTDKVLELLETVNKNGMAILLMTHDAKVSARAKRVVYLLDGVIKDELLFTEHDTQNEKEKRIPDLIEKY